MKNNDPVLNLKMLLLAALRRGLVLLLLLVALPALRSRAASPNPPQLMSYQGYLTDGNGIALGNTNIGPKNYDVVFRIWDLQTGGVISSADELYAEQQTVTVNNGYFSVLLGQGSQYSTEPHTNALSGLFVGANAAARFVEITVLGIGPAVAGVPGSITILPRLQLLTSPYSFLAANAVNAASAGSLVNNNNTTQVVTVTNGTVGIDAVSLGANLQIGPDYAQYLFSSPDLLIEGGPLGPNVGDSNNLATIGFTTGNACSLAIRALKASSLGGWSGAALGLCYDVDATPGAGGNIWLYEGNIGINTPTPTSPLTVNGAISANSVVLSNNGGGGLVNMFDPTDDPGGYGWSLFYGFYGHNSFGIGRYVPGSGYPANLSLTITTNGLVGIGTPTPTSTLSVAGTADFSGNVGIGTTAPAFPLDVTGSGRFSGSVQIGSGITSGFYGDGDNIALRTYANGAIYFQTPGGLTNLMYISPAGNVGIGTTTPSQPLEVNGNAQVDGNLAVAVGKTWGTYPGQANSSAVGNGPAVFTAATGYLGNSVGSQILSANLGFQGPNQCSLGVHGFRVNNGQSQSQWYSAALGLTYDVDADVAAGGGIYFLNGHTGIGTTTPNYPLEVDGSVNDGGFNYAELSSSGSIGKYNQTANPYSIYANNRILCPEFDAISDARIKEIVRRSDTGNDLATVRQLQITDYRKVDKVRYGNRLEKGVIAQEVETVIPDAVTTSTNFIPNIYALAKSVACTNQTLWVAMAKPHGLVVGDLVQLMTDTGDLKAAVTAVKSPLEFAVAGPAKAPAYLFVFGKQVGDFRAVNYDRLFSTGLGAIQELAKRTDQLEVQVAQVAKLEREVADLKKLVGQLADNAKNSKLTAGAAKGSSATLTTASVDR